MCLSRLRVVLTSRSNLRLLRTSVLLYQHRFLFRTVGTVPSMDLSPCKYLAYRFLPDTSSSFMKRTEFRSGPLLSATEITAMYSHFSGQIHPKHAVQYKKHLKMNPRSQTRQIMSEVVSKYSFRPSLATVQRRKYNFDVQRNPLMGTISMDASACAMNI